MLHLSVGVAKKNIQLQKHKIQKLKIYILADVNVLANGIIFKKLDVYEHLMLANDQGYIGCPNWKGLLSIYIKNKQQKFITNEKFVLIHNIYSHTYYHWLLEVLPRLYLVRDHLQTSVLLLPENYQESFHQETLAVFGVRRIKFINDHIIYKVPKLIVPSQIGKVANYHPKAIRKTASYIKSHVNLSLNIGNKIYVSRSKAKRRKILNEETLIVYLESHGFTTVHFEDFNFEEQVSIMHHCRYFVSIHGAGLSNMIFMKEGSFVYELRKDDSGENYFFCSLASTVNHNYLCQFCKSSDESDTVQYADIIVDMEVFENNIQRMLKS